MTVPPCSELLQVGARFPHGMLPGTERPPTDGSAAVVAVAALAQARLQFGHPRLLGRPAGGGFVAQAAPPALHGCRASSPATAS